MQRCPLAVIAALAVAVSNSRSFVGAAPHHTLSLHPNSALDLQSAFKNSGLRSEGQTIDEEVRELHNLNLKPFNNNLISMQQSNTRVFSDVNGQKEAHVENKQEVSEGGHKVGSLQVVADAKDSPQSATPATRVRGELEVPGQGVHRTFDSANKRKALFPSRPDAEENMVEGYRPFAGVQYSPLDMAEYVFWTGDEKGVTVAIEEFLQDGLMTREEAIAFLQEIKVNLEYLQNHYADERFQRQEMAKLQKALNFEAKMAVPSELSEVRQQMRENLNKKSAEVEDAFSPTMSRMAGLTDEDYQELLERLRVADFLYTEYSLEEIIYQLAKVMFSQSLTRGSSEAQEALQKFTGFLEAEAESGKISRSLEKKVLDVLIASLTDTLSERPELVGAARAGLGQDRNTNAGAIEKLLMMNKEQQAAAAEASKTANHRFQTGKESDAGVAMKKKSAPSSGRPGP